MLNGVVAICDDLHFNRVVLSRMLHQLGFTDVLCFESGCQLLQSRLRFVVILLDLVMPEQDGYATARAFREKERQRNTDRVPIIACTAEFGGSQEGRGGMVEAQCRLAGMDGCVGKPLSLSVLAALMLEHTGTCGGLRKGPERFRISCPSGELMQAWAQRQLSEASRARCAEDALPSTRRSLDSAWPPSGRGSGRGRLWDQEALTL